MDTEKRQRILQCENSPEGILSAVYEAFTSRYGHAYQHITAGTEVNMDLFSDIFEVRTDIVRAEKVAAAIKSKVSEYAWQMVWSVAEADHADKGEVIYRFLILAFANGRRALDAMNYLEVLQFHKLYRAVWRETQHLYGFLRFQELQNQILYGKLVSKHHVGTFLAEHFSDRLPMENWIIHDPDRDELWVHRAGNTWIYIQHPEFKVNPEDMLSASEYDFTAWWKTFTETIAIRERCNPKLQQQMMPKRYWKYMPEMTS